MDGAGLTLMWVFFLTWLGMTWAAFIKREADIGIRITRTEELLRYPLIAGVVLLSVMAYMGQGPVNVAPGIFWYPMKMILYAFALRIGLFLRYVMRGNRAGAHCGLYLLDYDFWSLLFGGDKALLIQPASISLMTFSIGGSSSAIDCMSCCTPRMMRARYSLMSRFRSRPASMSGA